jgi:hypothetical protein
MICQRSPGKALKLHTKTGVRKRAMDRTNSVLCMDSAPVFRVRGIEIGKNKDFLLFVHGL